MSDDENPAGVTPYPNDPGIDRRSLLRRLMAASASALWLASPTRAQGGGAASEPGRIKPLEVPPWTKTQGRPNGRPYGSPSPFEAEVRRRLPEIPLAVPPVQGSSWSFTPLQDLRSFVTPNGLVYERHHGGVPAIDPTRHRLVVHGLVERNMLFTVDDLLRFPAVSRFHFLECSGNSDSEFEGPGGWTPQFSHGLVSCCQWTGVSLRQVLAETGLRRRARWLLAEGADAAAMTRSIPLEKALDDCLVVYAQNGERLRPEQGYPLRLLVPGFEGNMNVKWLRRLEVGDQPFQTREETSRYTDLLADGKARQFTFVMEAKSVIVSPAGGQTLAGKGPHEIRGLAWSGRGRITRVDVSVDGGRNWRPALLDSPVLPKCLTYFRLPWKWYGKPAILASRAIDETGYVQPTHKQLVDVRGTHSVYHYNGIKAWRVEADGRVHHEV